MEVSATPLCEECVALLKGCFDLNVGFTDGLELLGRRKKFRVLTSKKTLGLVISGLYGFLTFILGENELILKIY